MEQEAADYGCDWGSHLHELTVPGFSLHRLPPAAGPLAFSDGGAGWAGRLSVGRFPGNLSE
ncbi:hypothetical protein J31TS4_09950 [Paenibacillus sp. J31TS4]|nr:hypothetical protein J31TS4_09950 [Paenibacillus sp. J31TS4]